MAVQLLGENSWRPRPKYLLFGLIGLMMLTVINRDRVLLNPHAPIWEHYRYFKWWLLPHGFAGSLALFSWAVAVLQQIASAIPSLAPNHWENVRLRSCGRGSGWHLD